MDHRDTEATEGDFGGSRASVDAEKPRYDLSGRVIGCAIEVHRELGPGLPEVIYQHCLGRELERHGIQYRREVSMPLHYKGVLLPWRFRLDLLVREELVVELKVVDRLLAVHEAQVINYLRMRGGGVGLLMNFQVSVLREGVRRFVV